MKAKLVKINANRHRWLCLLIFFVIFCTPATAWATFTIQTQNVVDITLTGFDGLKDVTFFQGQITTENPQLIDTPYRGLMLLVFAGGQSYPLVIGDSPFVVTIRSPAEPPSCTDSGENATLYQLLAGDRPASKKKYPFVDLLFEARDLLESTYTISTLAELTAKKNQLSAFVASNYPNLAHSDMLRRLMNQSLMMHEYVSYQGKGDAVGAVQQKYQNAVLDAVGGWLKALSEQIPGSEIVNSCVAFFYERSMVSLAALIIARFPDEAICPGGSDRPFPLAEDLTLTNAQGTWQGTLGDLKGEKTVALVADDCPVSMTVAVIKARELARHNAASSLIVAPLQKLSDTHRVMAKMIREEKILYINDEKWYGTIPVNRPRLPFIYALKK